MLFLCLLGANVSKTRRKKTPVIPTSCVFEIPLFYQQTLARKRFFVNGFLFKMWSRVCDCICKRPTTATII